MVLWIALIEDLRSWCAGGVRVSNAMSPCPLPIAGQLSEVVRDDLRRAYRHRKDSPDANITLKFNGAKGSGMSATALKRYLLWNQIQEGDKRYD